MDLAVRWLTAPARRATMPPVPDDDDDDWSYTGVPRWVAVAFAVVVGLGLLAGMIEALTH
jgi:hypothetical protein